MVLPWCFLGFFLVVMVGSEFGLDNSFTLDECCLGSECLLDTVLPK